MDRKTFFKILIGGVAGVIVGAKAIKEKHKFAYEYMYPLTPSECYESYNDDMEFWYDFSRCMRVERNGFYTIGDVFYAGQERSLFIVKHMDDKYCYCYPR